MSAVLSDLGPTSPDERVAALLLARGKLKDADPARARRLQEDSGDGLLSLLGRLGLISERDHAEACASELGLPLRSGKDVPELPSERTLRSTNFSWAPRDWPRDSPWLRMFRNARTWLG